MKLISILILVLLGAVPTVHPATRQSGLTKEIVRLEAAYGGHLGFMAKNLRTGETVGYNAGERFPTASVIKLPVLAAFFQLVDEKKIDPNAGITLRQDEIKPGMGALQLLSDGDQITLLDAARLMIDQSDNTATNLLLDRLAPTHAQRMAIVNDFLVGQGFKNTKLLNRLYSIETKPRTSEALRYGIGVTTPEEMVMLLEKLYAKTLVSPSSCDAMLAILKNQSDRAMVPRFLPADECKYIEIGNKTGSVNETKADVALILSDKADLAIAVFVDKHADHRDDVENRAVLLGAMAARAVWNYFTGSTGYEARKIPNNDVDWNLYPGGRWGIYRSAAAPFPHPARKRGFKVKGHVYPFHPHYDDSSIIVVVPESFKETSEGTNIIIHFHGQMDDNLGVLEKFELPQALSAEKINAILVLPQGPYRAEDSFGGKMEDSDGLKRLVDDVLSTMKNEKIIETVRLNQLLLSAEDSGIRTAALGLKRGGLEDQTTGIFLFGILQGNEEIYRDWLMSGNGFLYAAYPSRMESVYQSFARTTGGKAGNRLHLAAAASDSDANLRTFFESWLKELGPPWKAN